MTPSNGNKRECYCVDFVMNVFHLIQDQSSQMATRAGWVIAAIDFGTTYSGYAFSFPNELTSESTRKVKP